MRKVFSVIRDVFIALRVLNLCGGRALATSQLERKILVESVSGYREVLLAVYNNEKGFTLVFRKSHDLPFKSGPFPRIRNCLNFQRRYNELTLGVMHIKRNLSFPKVYDSPKQKGVMPGNFSVRQTLVQATLKFLDKM